MKPKIYIQDNREKFEKQLPEFFKKRGEWSRGYIQSKINRSKREGNKS